MHVVGVIQEICSSPKMLIWQIDGFFDRGRLDRFYDYSSPEFSFDGKNWRLLARRQRDEFFGHTSLGLSGDPSYTGSFHWELEINRHDGTLLQKSCGVRIHEEFIQDAPARRGLYAYTLPEEESLIIMPYRIKRACSNDPRKFLAVRCKLYREDQKLTSTEASSTTEENLGPGKLARDLKELLSSGENSDVTIRVGDHEFRVHSAILVARTPVFASMFKHDMAEKATGIVNIEDCEADIFRMLLHYVYTGTAEDITAENVFALYEVADKYQVDELKSECFTCIRITLSVDMICDTIALAAKYVDHELMDVAVDFLSEHEKEVISSEKWQIFLSDKPTMCNELLLEAGRRQNGRRAEFWDFLTLDF